MVSALLSCATTRLAPRGTSVAARSGATKRLRDIIRNSFRLARLSVDPEALLHRVALVPDVDVVGRELARPLRCQLIDAARRDAIDVVIEHGPRVADVRR